MHEPNERVVIDLHPEARMRLGCQILRRMKEMGLDPFHYAALDLGFPLSEKWPDSPADEITIAQFGMLAEKLDMRLTIDNANLSHMPADANH